MDFGLNYQFSITLIFNLLLPLTSVIVSATALTLTTPLCPPEIKNLAFPNYTKSIANGLSS
jgi:hypothetical protein